MDLMYCMRGEPGQHKLLSEIESLNAGIELGSYGLAGVASEEAWQERLGMHKKIAAGFNGRLAMHGPFIGIDYSMLDSMLLDAIKKRLDMTFKAACELKVERIILHSGCQAEYIMFGLQDYWLQKTSEFWKKEIIRWEKAHIEVVLENLTEKNPDLMIELVDEVNNPGLGICFDIGHQNIFSEQSASEWVRDMGHRLRHVHLHDNDGIADKHWSMGKGVIDFNRFYKAIEEFSPDVTISLESSDEDEVKMNDLRNLHKRFSGNPTVGGLG